MLNRIEGNPIAPKLRPGEVIGEVPDGMVPTRHYGEIVFVSAPTETDQAFGKSPYTIRQVKELDTRRAAIESAMQNQPDFQSQFKEVIPGQAIVNVFVPKNSESIQ